jgi:hypothetical protein
VLSSDFHCKENDGFQVIPVQRGLTSHAGSTNSDPDFMNSIIIGIGLINEMRFRVDILSTFCNLL